MPSRAVVLVIEDDRDLNESITDLLTSEGYSCVAAFNGARGVALLTQHEPDLVTLDVGLPDMNGLDVLSRKRATPELADIPVIVITEKPVPPMLPGVAAILRKPFDLDDLLALVQKLAPLDST